MSSVNKVILIGNLGTEPEVKEFQNGTKVANFSLATSERFKDKNGEQQENTEWHNVSVFGKQAEIIEKYVKKGDKLYLEGSIHTRKWQDKEGNDRYTTEIKAYNFTMLGGGVQKAASKTEAVLSNDGDEDDLLF